MISIGIVGSNYGRIVQLPAFRADPRCGDAKAALKAAQAIAHHGDKPDALHWLVVARHRIDGLETSRTSLMRLALLRPARLPRVLCDIADPLLDRDWRAFQAAFHWLDPEDRAAGAWYPVWHLVEHPGIRIDCAGSTPLPATEASQAFNAIARLIDLEKHGYSSSLISARRALRDLDAQVFDFYMARRNIDHR